MERNLDACAAQAASWHDKDAPDSKTGLIVTARHGWQKYLGLIRRESAQAGKDEVWLA